MPRRSRDGRDGRDGRAAAAAAVDAAAGNDITCPFDLAKKLRGAVQARDLKTLQRLFRRPEAADMDDRSIAFVVRTAVEQHSGPAMALLLEQGCVQALGPRAIAGLLQTSIRYKNVAAVLALSGLDGAQHINTAYISYLLGEATSLGHAGAIQALSVLQGHQTELEQLVPAGSLEGALRTAVLQGRRTMVYHMAEHEGVQALEGSAMVGILGTAIYHRSGVITRYLCWAEAAQRLPPASVGGLMQAALQVGDRAGLDYLIEDLPGSRGLDGEATIKLLTAALQQPDCTMLCRLVHLPSAQALGPGACAALLHTALSDTPAGSVADAVCALCELLPGAHRIKAVNVLQLLRCALAQHGSDTISHLCGLPGAQQLGAADCLGLVRLAATQAAPERGTAGAKGHKGRTAALLASDDRSGSSSRGSSPVRSSSPSSSSSGSGSSSPILLMRSRSGRSSASSAGSCPSSRSSSPGSCELVGVLCRQLSGAQHLQPDLLAA